MNIETKVRVLDEGGNVCAVGLYKGTGIPSRDLNAKYPELQHYAVYVDGQMRYYPVGLHTLIEAPR